MKKIFSLLAAVLFAGSMMAATATMQYTGGVTTNMVGNGANNAETVGLDATLFTVLAYNNGNQNLPGLNKANDIRLYADKNTGNGNTIVVSIANGTITSIELNIKQTATFVVKAGENEVTESEGAYAINAASFSIQNTTTGATTQLQLNSITITYEAEGGGGEEEGQYAYDEDADLTYAFNSYTVDDEYLLDDGDVFIEAFDEQSGYQVILDLYVPQGATGLVAGTYPINDSYEASSVADGFYDEGMIYPSYAGIVDGEGLLKVWYLVSGTVTVSEDLSIAIVAQNSLGHDITIAIANGGEGSAVEATKAEIKAIKRIENGQLVIIKNGVKYNAVGTVVR